MVTFQKIWQRDPYRIGIWSGFDDHLKQSARDRHHHTHLTINGVDRIQSAFNRLTRYDSTIKSNSKNTEK